MVQHYRAPLISRGNTHGLAAALDSSLGKTINMCRLRINAPPTRSSVARGRPKDRQCRGGCGTAESLNNILQYVAMKLHRAEYHIEEPVFNSNEGPRKPDLTATLGCTTFVIDIGITSEKTDLDKMYRDKSAKFGENGCLMEGVKRKNGSDTVLSIAATISCRGVWSKASANELIRKGLLRSQDLMIISSRVLIGSIAEWNIFNKTTMARHRSGIG